jgi:hypothetical protein
MSASYTWIIYNSWNVFRTALLRWNWQMIRSIRSVYVNVQTFHVISSGNTHLIFLGIWSVPSCPTTDTQKLSNFQSKSYPQYKVVTPSLVIVSNYRDIVSNISSWTQWSSLRRKSWWNPSSCVVFYEDWTSVPTLCQVMFLMTHFL